MGELDEDMEVTIGVDVDVSEAAEALRIVGDLAFEVSSAFYDAANRLEGEIDGD